MLHKKGCGKNSIFSIGGNNFSLSAIAIFLENSMQVLLTSKHQHVPRVGQLHGKQQKYALHTEHSSVNVIPQKEVPVSTSWTPDCQKLQQVVVLPMDVSYNYHRRWHFQHCGFFKKQLRRILYDMRSTVYRKSSFRFHVAPDKTQSRNSFPIKDVLLRQLLAGNLLGTWLCKFFIIRLPDHWAGRFLSRTRRCIKTLTWTLGWDYWKANTPNTPHWRCSWVRRAPEGARDMGISRANIGPGPPATFTTITAVWPPWPPRLVWFIRPVWLKGLFVVSGPTDTTRVLWWGGRPRFVRIGWLTGLHSIGVGFARLSFRFWQTFCFWDLWRCLIKFWSQFHDGPAKKSTQLSEVECSA